MERVTIHDYSLGNQTHALIQILERIKGTDNFTMRFSSPDPHTEICKKRGIRHACSWCGCKLEDGHCLTRFPVLPETEVKRILKEALRLQRDGIKIRVTVD